ncbi:hypothetical protein DYQ86_12605 [Acidobacteria bacterium AB60]|nr:hypothetical protein DYQ86_12605 [Acidobacteria bacterium AB60]
MAIGVAAVAQAPVTAPPPTTPSVKTEKTAVNLMDVPPLPRGKSTILGGQIREIDAVRDRFMLHVYGEKPMRILFDARTQLFVDGNRIPLHDLKPAEHASVQTTLDGDKVFALTVHILSESPQGAFEGRILDFDPGSGMLTMLSQGSQQQFRVRVTNTTTVKREGQSAFTAENRGQSDLVRGALVSLSFQSDNKGQGTAREVTVLATPGASFVFMGTVTALNVANGYFMVTDPRDQRTYQIRCNPQDPVVLRLHVGDHVRVTADYDGTRYAATRIEETGSSE